MRGDGAGEGTAEGTGGRPTGGAPGDGGQRLVVDMRDRRPVWMMPAWALEELEAALPDGWELFVASSFADGSGDGSGVASEEVLEAVAGARIYLGFGIAPEILRAGEGSLAWVHSGAAGVGSSLHPEMLRSRVRFTNSAGIHGPPMAETALGMLLHLFRGLDFAVAGQREARWDTEPFLRADTPVREVAGATVGILGYGGVGREVARRVAALGARVLGLRRSAPGPGLSRAPSGLPRDDLGVELLHGDEGLDRLVAESEALVVTAPDTPETRGVLTRERIRALPRGAVVLNLARGRLVDEDALLEALTDGHLRGAGLDVFATEPLPSDSPFWRLPNVLITPHVSAVTRGFWRREMDLVLGNLGAFLADPAAPLRNEVDRGAGY
jgi:phosphoglycerate dehydrogenase-like enzyme